MLGVFPSVQEHRQSQEAFGQTKVLVGQPYRSERKFSPNYCESSESFSLEAEAPCLMQHPKLTSRKHAGLINPMNHPMTQTMVDIMQHKWDAMVEIGQVPQVQWLVQIFEELPPSVRKLRPTSVLPYPLLQYTPPYLRTKLKVQSDEHSHGLGSQH